MMRWKFSSHSHDPRILDLVAAIALVIAVIAVCRYVAENESVTPSATALIEPSQNVHW
jgi:hypothetical protein